MDIGRPGPIPDVIEPVLSLFRLPPCIAVAPLSVVSTNEMRLLCLVFNAAKQHGVKSESLH